MTFGLCYAIIIWDIERTSFYTLASDRLRRDSKHHLSGISIIDSKRDISTRGVRVAKDRSIVK